MCFVCSDCVDFGIFGNLMLRVVCVRLGLLVDFMVFGLAAAGVLSRLPVCVWFAWVFN